MYVAGRLRLHRLPCRTGRGRGSASANDAPPPLPDYDQPALSLKTATSGRLATGLGAAVVITGCPAPGCSRPAWVCLWTPGYWGFVGGGVCLFHAGYWGPHIGYYGGVNYGLRLRRRGLSRAAAGSRQLVCLQSQRHQREREPWCITPYNETVVNNVTVNKVSYNGGPGGTQRLRPTPQETAASGRASYWRRLPAAAAACAPRRPATRRLAAQSQWRPSGHRGHTSPRQRSSAPGVVQCARRESTAPAAASNAPSNQRRQPGIRAVSSRPRANRVLRPNTAQPNAGQPNAAHPNTGAAQCRASAATASEEAGAAEAAALSRRRKSISVTRAATNVTGCHRDLAQDKRGRLAITRPLFHQWLFCLLHHRQIDKTASSLPPSKILTVAFL